MFYADEISLEMNSCVAQSKKISLFFPTFMNSNYECSNKNNKNQRRYIQRNNNGKTRVCPNERCHYHSEDLSYAQMKTINIKDLDETFYF